MNPLLTPTRLAGVRHVEGRVEARDGVVVASASGAFSRPSRVSLDDVTTLAALEDSARVRGPASVALTAATDVDVSKLARRLWSIDADARRELPSAANLRAWLDALAAGVT